MLKYSRDLLAMAEELGGGVGIEERRKKRREKRGKEGDDRKGEKETGLCTNRSFQKSAPVNSTICCSVLSMVFQYSTFTKATNTKTTHIGNGKITPTNNKINELLLK